MANNKVLSITRFVNNTKIEQRVEDGFVNATSMCLAHGKFVKDWLKTLSTLEVFIALALDRNSNFKWDNIPISDVSTFTASKYQKFFPKLIISKQGSSEFGGGTWIHPDLAIQLAQWCNPSFAIQVSRWVREWLVQGFQEQNKTITQLEREYEVYLDRHSLRITLKDSLRVELMEATVKYARTHQLNPYELCWKVHDTMNIKIQGHRSKDLKVMGSLPIGDLIRDYFDSNSLVMYTAINKIAVNNIVDRGLHPIDATENACRSYLGSTYSPKPHRLSENLYQQGQRIQKKIKSQKVYQLNLFDNQNIS